MKRQYTLAEVKQSYDPENARSEKYDSWPVYWVFRPLSFPIAQVCLNLGISAKGVTLLSLIVVLSLPVYVLMDWPSAHIYIAAAATGFMVMDCVDGNMARVSGTANPQGRYLDFLVDTVFRLCLYGAIGLLAMDGETTDSIGYILALAICAAWLVTASRLLRDYAASLMETAESKIFPEVSHNQRFLDYCFFFFSGVDFLTPLLVFVFAYFSLLPVLVFWLLAYAVIEFCYTQFLVWQKLS